MVKEIDKALELLHEMEHQTQKREKNIIHPISRFLVTIVFIVMVVSFDKYEPSSLLGMMVYICIMTIMEDIPILKMLSRIKIIILALFLVGIANPIFDRIPVLLVGNIPITTGMLSMITLFLKGIFSLCAAYILIMETGIQGMCVAMRTMKIPETIVTVVMLIYRYIILLLQEVRNMLLAYSLRAPGQKGIKINAWGSFVGQLLLRSMDRAIDVHNAMVLRGYNGNFSYERNMVRENASILYSILYALMWICIIIGLRVFPISALIMRFL